MLIISIIAFTLFFLELVVCFTSIYIINHCEELTNKCIEKKDEEEYNMINEICSEPNRSIFMNLAPYIIFQALFGFFTSSYAIFLYFN